jgi:hypothetical protein
MSRRRLTFPTAHHVGPFRIVTMRQVRGYAILDDRTGRPAWTEAHPITGRPRALMVPTVPVALRIARSLEP